MKSKLLLLLLSFYYSLFIGQDSLAQKINLESSIITFNPTKETKNTNGINIGVIDSYEKQKINGINLQLNPFLLVYLLIPKAIEIPENGEETVSINGLHISTGGITDGKNMNGIGISMYHISQETNGICINGFNSKTGKMNGLQLSFINNYTENGNGVQIALSNYGNHKNGLQVGLANETNTGNGLQIGIYNKTKKQKGIQIGLINKSENRGLQIGFWNKNAKRTLPIINF